MATRTFPVPQQERISAREDGVSSGVDFEFSFAFQPIVDAELQEIVSYEALVRGPHGESAAEVFSKVPRTDRYVFDQACRLKAIHLARRLNLETRLNLNLLPHASRRGGTCIRATLQASSEEGFPAERLVFEVSEAERLHHYARVGSVFQEYRDWGFRTAIDDFGNGFSGMRMLAEYLPDYIKLDRQLISDIHRNHVKQAVVKGITRMCRQLSIQPIAEGVEKAEEYHWLRRIGIRLFQGFYFARPTFEALCDVRPTLF